MTNQLVAHTPRAGSSEWHDLEEHIREVARLARAFAEPFGGATLAYQAGIWHDVGKANPDFQDYLHRCHVDPNQKGTGGDHKAAGALLATRFCEPLALLVQGHHGGLKNKAELAGWLTQMQEVLVTGESTSRVDAAIATLRARIPEIEPSVLLTVPPFVRDKQSAEFFLRILFSTLVDADFLDTEAHGSPHKTILRGNSISIQELQQRFDTNQNSKRGGSGPVNIARDTMYQHCLDASCQSPGLFRLAMPTGGGKTRAGMGFALHHAAQHGKRRIIVAVPFISITEQTAGVYREIFDDTDDDRPIVLEHHSGAGSTGGDTEDYTPGAVWSRLAAENWDAPIIVTTTVQLFESLFGNRTGVCRKLHWLANSVIILDEAQALPPHLLTPILDGLRELCQNYGATVILSTATQPAFESITVFKDVRAYDIIPDAARYFAALSRVQFEWRLEQPMHWRDVATEMRATPQVLAVLNTKGNALMLLDELDDDDDVLHLSTLLCGAHRRTVIAEVKRRLAAGDPCRLVSTQVIEAGVDLDFPLVMRAMGPLDRIVQAAGRCNREGRLASKGVTIIFNPEGGGLPPGAYRTATDITRALVRSNTLDLDDPAAWRTYFDRLFNTVDLDRERVQQQRAAWNYADVAQRMRMIDEDTEDVIITTYGDATQKVQVTQAIATIRARIGSARAAFGKLQPFVVSIRAKTAEQYRRQGFVEPLVPDSKLTVGIWHGKYDAIRGIVTDDDRARLII